MKKIHKKQLKSKNYLQNQIKPLVKSRLTIVSREAKKKRSNATTAYIRRRSADTNLAEKMSELLVKQVNV